MAHETAQENIPTCEKHTLKTIDIICEDCDEFICSQCAKTDHKDHDWKTISTAGSLRRRKIISILHKVKEKDVKEIEEKINKAFKQTEDNQTCCDSEASKLQKQFDTIVSKLEEIKKNYEKTLRENLKRKNAEVSEHKLDIENKKEKVMELVKFLEDKNSSMSDYDLIDNFRDLFNLLSNKDCELVKGDHSEKYREGNISEGKLESMMGQTFDLDDFTITETESFQYGDKEIVIMEAFDEDTCFMSNMNSGCIDQVNRRNKKGESFRIRVSDVCVTDNGDVYATDFDGRSIACLSASGLFSTIFNTAPLLPLGICQATKGLLVSLRDTESEKYQPDISSRRLVRHVTLTGDVICEYEFQEDGQTRLFNIPREIKQNANTDICVVNRTSKSTGELVILSLNGSLKFVYRGQKLVYSLNPTDVVFDSHCNIIVSDLSNNKIHLLSPDGELMKYLLTEKDVTDPISMSFYKPTLWVGNSHGLVKVFQFNN